MKKHILDIIHRLHNKFYYHLTHIRAGYYKLFFNIGHNCNFQKIVFYKPTTGSMGRNSIQIDNNVTIFRNTELLSFDDRPIIIGRNTFINQECLIRPNVTIGQNVSIGMRTCLISDTHEIGTSENRAGKSLFLPIKIENGCWIGSGSTILGGVTIGNGAIIASNSLVNKNCEPNCLYGGIPAKFIKKLD